ITVNNVPPHVDPPEGGPNGENQSSDEGQNKSFEVGSFTDPGADGPWSVTVDWGDGSADTIFDAASPGALPQKAHTYDDNGTYDVTVTVAENGANAASGQASFQVTVNNVSPTGVLGNNGPVNEGDNATISFTGQTEPSTADNNAGLRYAYNCDGSVFGTIPTYASLAGSSASQHCSFADNSSHTVRALIMDKDGGYNVYTTSVEVNNTAPTVTLLSGPDLVKESTTIERAYTFNATDAGSDELTIVPDCGANGNLVDTNGTDPGGTYEYDPATGDGSFECIFPDGGLDNSTKSNVTVRATDDDGLSDSDNQIVIVTVSNDNPQATFNAPASVNEGDNIDLSLTDATDPAGPNDTLEYRFDCGNGFGAWGSSNIASCPTNDSGNVIVKGQVSDEDGGLSDIYEKTVTVNNVAPKVVVSGPDTANEGDTRQYDFTVTDAGSADTFTIEGGYPTCGANGQFVPGSLQTTATGGSFRCLFPDGDSITNVEIQVRDDDGALDADSQRVVIVNVANVAPDLTPAVNQNSDEGQNKLFDLGSFTDPGTDDPWSVTVDWGDGSAATNFDAASPGGLPQRAHTYADNGTYTVTVTVVEAGGAPSDSDTFTVTVANAAPGISLTGPDTANEGDTKQYNFTVTDAGTNDTHTIARDCGVNGEEVANSFTYDKNTRTGSFECRFPNGPAQTNVTVRATDNDGASDADNQVVTVRVANVAPTVDLTGPGTANENDTKLYNFTVTDPGNDTHTIDWDCGANGEKVNGSFSYDPSTKTGSFECRFPNGPANSTVSLSANDGNDTGSDSIIVHVANVAPTANDDQMTTTELKDVTGNILDNDTDPGNDLDRASLEILSINALSPTPAGPHGGVVTISNLLDGNVTYTPNRGFVDIDSFRYKVCDDDGDCSEANVQVTVDPVDCNADGVIRGTSGADILRGTPGDDVICAFGGNDRIYAGAGDDLLVGDTGLDRMWGEGGNDVMRGGGQTDAMDAGLGDDYITGDTGRDVIMARGGVDFIELRDGSSGDAADGGAGKDQCKKDAGDKTVSCELQ
ncbi:MAG TPA: PKD domain-containing protein, partial [Rubrobacter sp.]|nr:PKD domain-containing protein [Rubrobacter sp.]